MFDLVEQPLFDHIGLLTATRDMHVIVIAFYCAITWSIFDVSRRRLIEASFSTWAPLCSILLRILLLTIIQWNNVYLQWWANVWQWKQCTEHTALTRPSGWRRWLDSLESQIAPVVDWRIQGYRGGSSGGHPSSPPPRIVIVNLFRPHLLSNCAEGNICWKVACLSACLKFCFEVKFAVWWWC